MNKNDDGFQLATFAGGCFWCMVAPFEQMEGVIRVISGYTGGRTENPGYKEVCSGSTGHFEAVQVTYNPLLLPYNKLLDTFWRQIDPTDAGGQFHDRGSTYQTAIFYHNEAQQRDAQASKKALQESGRFKRPIATRILPAGAFYPAEEYHQHYHRKSPLQYALYRTASGRDEFISSQWGKDPAEEGLKKSLSELQYQVTQNSATEPPFNNLYWNHKEEGIYVDLISGEPLFSSTDKFDSHSGWPSFAKTLEPGNIKENLDCSYNMIRTEVRSKAANSHLGHLFPDGPGPNGLRYCINSAALRFIPRRDLEREGYGEYCKLFQ